MKFLITALSAIGVFALAISSTQAGFILAGNHVLFPNQSNQVINVLASPTMDGEIAVGLNLNFVVDDGGSIVGGIDNNAPRITSINLKPEGGLFASIPDIQTNVFASQKLYQVTIAPTNVANRPVITSNVLLAQVTLDTTGLASGTWMLDLDGLPLVGLSSSDFAGFPATVVNGTVSINPIPEPRSLWILVLVASRTALHRTARRGNPDDKL